MNKQTFLTINLYGKHENCILAWHKYSNGQPAIQILTSDGQPLVTASVCMPEHTLPKDHIFIKNYSENTGIMEELIRHNIIKDTGKTISSGFVEINLCKIIKTQKGASNDQN